MSRATSSRAASRGLWLMLLAVGAVILIVAGSRPWFRQSFQGPFGRAIVKSSHGLAAQYSTAVGLLFLAAIAATFAVNPRMRVLFGGLLVLVAGTSVVVIAFAGASYLDNAPGALISTHQNRWSYLAAFGALLCGASGFGIAIFGRNWSAMGQRYEAGAEAKRASKIASDPWLAMDEGIDPTLEKGPPRGL